MIATLTELERSCINTLIPLLDNEPGYSDVSTRDLARATGIPMKIFRGVIGSLVKKDVLVVDDSCGVEIVYLQTSHWNLHPRWVACRG